MIKSDIEEKNDVEHQRGLMETLLEEAKKDSLSSKRKEGEGEGHKALRHISYELRRMSIVMGYHVYNKANYDRIPASKDIDVFIYDLDKLFKFQTSQLVNKYVVLSVSEIEENYAFWEEVSPRLINRILIKEMYFLKVIQDYLTFDSKLKILFTTALANFARSINGFVDAKRLKNIVKKEQEEKTQKQIEENAQIALSIIHWAVEECSFVWAKNKEMFWGAKVVHFLSLAHSYHIILHEDLEAAEVQERIEAVQRRISKESDDAEQSTQKKRKLSALSLEELLRYDKK